MKANNASGASLHYLAGDQKRGLSEKEVKITIVPGVDTRNIGPEHLDALRRACAESGNGHPVITSGFRSVESQIRAMLANLERDYKGQRRLYLAAGQKIIDVYDACKKEGKSRNETLSAMIRKANEIGPGNVSRHCDTAACVFDIGVSSLENASALTQEMKKYAAKVLDERSNGNRCIHIEFRSV